MTSHLIVNRDLKLKFEIATYPSSVLGSEVHIMTQKPVTQSQMQGQTVRVTLTKSSGEIWLETGAVSVRCTMSDIIFDVARVDRHDSVVPYLIYGEEVQPYWKSLSQF